MAISGQMQLALEEGRRALGWSSPNPAVGAVVVRDGEVVGTGRTQPPGGDHAEVGALRAIGRAAPASSSRSSPARTAAAPRPAPRR